MPKSEGWRLSCDKCATSEFVSSINTGKRLGWLLNRQNVLCVECRPPIEVKEGVPHGTWNAYANHGCRCDECRAAASDYTKTQRHGGFAKW